mmetsp:Transcript_7574/g.15757  ORF Transcript_7574/g.15757 Transcript_7574/m.15757 type:complete len:201 (-) Transcript_7574:442-1044(-)
MTSQMPSHASTKNSSSGFRSLARTSGVEHTICSSALRSLRFLYSKSPIARLKFRLPLTRAPPGLSTKCPPAASILAFSTSEAGLWSKDSSTAWPLRQRMARLSPALAARTCPFLTRTQIAVQPTWSATKSSPFSACSYFCSRTNWSRISICSAAVTPPFWARICAAASCFRKSAMAPPGTFPTNLERVFALDGSRMIVSI